jgi:superfamily II DNA or RNA helicase
VQVASIQTLHRRAIQADKMQLPPADLLVIDEAHHCPAASYRKIIAAYPNAILLGLTATPCRGDGRGLGSIFDTIIQAPQVAELIGQGHLVKTRVYAPVDPDLRGVKVQAGDYILSQLADRMDRSELIGDIVTHWHKYSERRKTVAFTVNVAHSVHLRDEFIKSGVRAEHIDGTTPKDERDATLARLASGDVDVVCNCMVLTEGFDCPDMGCIILARPTRSMGLFRQMVGRALRPAPGKTTRLFSIIPALCSGMVLSRITSTGSSVPTCEPEVWITVDAATIMARRSCSNARNAVPSAIKSLRRDTGLTSTTGRGQRWRRCIRPVCWRGLHHVLDWQARTTTRRNGDRNYGGVNVMTLLNL